MSITNERIYRIKILTDAFEIITIVIKNLKKMICFSCQELLAWNTETVYIIIFSKGRKRVSS